LFVASSVNVNKAEEVVLRSILPRLEEVVVVVVVVCLVLLVETALLPSTERDRESEAETEANGCFGCLLNVGIT